LENAARGGHLEAVQTLLGAKVRIRTRPCDDIGFLCLSAAVRGGHAHVVHALAEAKADVNDNYMFVPGTDGRMLGAGVPGAPGPGVKKWDLCKGVLVFGAVHCGQVDVLRALLQYKASMDYWRHGQTVLHMAAERGAQEDVVALACRAVSAATLNACAETGTGETALHMAVARGNVRFVRSLLRCKAHVDVGRRDTGQTPLHSALQLPLPGFGDRPSVRADVLTRILVDAKANIHKRLGPDGMAPVHLATLRTSDCGALAVLVHAKVDVNFSTYAGVTPVRVAVNHGAWHALQLLLEAKGRADVALTADGTTPLHGALRSSPGSLLVRMLVDAKADVDAADTGRGYTPVHVAVLLDRIEALRVLLKAKASADKATTRRGASPLVIAARNNCSAAAKVLFSAKADLTKASRASGDTPVQVAVSRGHVHLAALLTGSQLPF
jgi:ankyrin repeat protein